MLQISRQAYPSAGSVYYWSARMAPPKWAPFIAYTTGWLNFIGNTAADAFFAAGVFSIMVAFATSISNVFTMAGDKTYAKGLPVATNTAVGILVLAVWSALNSLRIDIQCWPNFNRSLYSCFWCILSGGYCFGSCFFTRILLPIFREIVSYSERSFYHCI
jgi:amino acid transporter